MEQSENLGGHVPPVPPWFLRLWFCISDSNWVYLVSVQGFANQAHVCNHCMILSIGSYSSEGACRVGTRLPLWVLPTRDQFSWNQFSWNQLLMKSILMNSTTHEINSHEINYSWNQFSWNQLLIEALVTNSITFYYYYCGTWFTVVLIP